MLKSFVTILSLSTILCFGPLHAEEPVKVVGSFTLKKRVKGEIIESIKWYPLPEFLDEHMGIPKHFKIIGKTFETGTLILSFKSKKAKPITKILNIKNNESEEKFSFIDFYYEYISGNEGALSITVEDAKKKKIYTRVIPTRGDAG